MVITKIKHIEMSSNSSACLVSSIESELTQVKENLRGVDESLKRLTGRDFGERRIDRRIHNINRDGPKINREEEPAIKKKGPTGIFARLGAPILDGNRRDNRENRQRFSEFSREKEDIPRKRPTLSSSVARPVNDGKSRSEAAAELTKDRASRDRNRRMFGALLGTLQKFQNDEAKQKDKEDQRAAIEKKLEDKGKAEKEELRKERAELFNQRLEQQAKIKFLQYKMNRIREHDCWENHQKKLRKYIRTVSKPNIFWLPKISTEKSHQLIKQTKMDIGRELEEKREQLKNELENISNKRDIASKDEIEEDAEGPQTKKMKLAEDTLEDTLGDLEDNCADILDFEVEEPRQVEEVNPSGKGSNPERVVVQLGSGVNVLGNSSQRRVELVPASHNGMKEHELVEGEMKSDAREVRIVVKRERSKERVKVRKSNCDEGSKDAKECKSVRSVQEVKESIDMRIVEVNIAQEESPVIDVNAIKKEDAIEPAETVTSSVQEQPTEVQKARSKSPAEVDSAISSMEEANNIKVTSQPAVIKSITMKEKSLSPKAKKNGSSSSSSSDDSDDYGDSSSSSDSESSETDSSDSTTSSSTDSEIEKKREMRKKTILAARKREEERRRKRGISNSSSNVDDEKPVRKRSREVSPNDKRSTGNKSDSKRAKPSDETATNGNRKRSKSRDRHRRRSAERKTRK